MTHSRIFQLLSVIFLLSWATNAFAQGPISFGVRGGLNFASASVTDLPTGSDISPLTLLGVGGVAEMGLSDLIYLQAEPRYIQKGAKINLTIWGLTASLTSKFDYVEIPVSLKAKFDVGTVKPYVFAGPTVSFLLSAKGETEFQGQKETQDIKNLTESTEFSLDFGAGAAYKIAPGTSLTGDFRYTLGLSKVNKASDPNDKSTWKSTDIMLFVGVLFTL